jgi:Uma2 family endonuclease
VQLDKLLHCSKHGTELGWMLDSEAETILAVDASQRLQIFHGEATIPTLPELGLNLTATQIFGWLVF